MAAEDEELLEVPTRDTTLAAFTVGLKENDPKRSFPKLQDGENSQRASVNNKKTELTSAFCLSPALFRRRSIYWGFTLQIPRCHRVYASSFDGLL